MEAITLEPMTEAEFGEFMILIHSTYVAERATADRISQEEAERFARQQYARLLPKGRLSDGHQFLRIASAASRESLGGLWVHTDIAARCAFLYNITVFAEFRRHGFAREALTLLQDRVRALGCATLALNVFSTNVAAIRLYESSGFAQVSRHMNKAL
ncbi:MAG TPA: GNAT family N-acetyltransferase [Burkholderiales bacterium]|nr:GNAT family N-acetyltransferase [Burkholderiales bacterium]